MANDALDYDVTNLDVSFVKRKTSSGLLVYDINSAIMHGTDKCTSKKSISMPLCGDTLHRDFIKAKINNIIAALEEIKCNVDERCQDLF